LPDYKVIIEYDGEHHFRKIYDNYNFVVEGDMLLENWCLKNNCRLIRVDEIAYKKDRSKVIELLNDSIIHGKEKIFKVGDRYKE
jgi:very-short-patch-repair endonuclease